MYLKMKGKASDISLALTLLMKCYKSLIAVGN